MKKNASLLFILLVAFSLSLHAKVIHVDNSHVGGVQNGISWANAFSNLQTAIDSSRAGDSIWVAKGTYKHYYNASAFAMKDSVKIFGGFLSTHVNFQDRDWDKNGTILQGNGYMVVLNSISNKIGPEAWLDGFTVTGGVKGGMENSFSSPTINNCTFLFNANSSTSAAAAMQNSSCSSVISNCKFLNNQGSAAVVNAGFGAFAPTNEQGPRFANCVFSDNTGSNAGAVRNSGCIVNFTNCDFSSNKSSFHGGAMASTQALVTITDCRFNNNEASEYGGGVFLDKCISTITACSFKANRAKGGGGLANQSDTAIRYMNLSHCLFDGNKATRALRSGLDDRQGGGVLNRAKANISFCTFQNNVSGYDNLNGGGGGLYSTSGSANMISSINNCRFYNNKTLVTSMTYWASNATGGGALVNLGNVTDCFFEGNEATVRGGGLTMYGNSAQDGIVNRCQFIGNKSQNGGGVCGTGNVRMYNCLLAKNTADSTGGGLHLDVDKSYAANLSNNTISANKGRTGGGIYLNSYSTVNTAIKISNNIIWGNNTGIAKLNAVPYPNVAYSLIQGWPAYAPNHVFDSSIDPLFVDTAAGNFQLLVTSPCADMGRNDSLPAAFNADLLNHGRIYNATIDLGAYEYGVFPPEAFPGNDTAVCSNTKLTIRLPYQSATSFSWNTGDTTTSIEVAAPGKYYVTVSNALGTASDTILVKHNAVPQVDLGSDTSVCGKVLLDAKIPGASYLWSNNVTSQTILVGAGTYSLIVTDTNLCRSMDTIKVLQLPLPAVYLGKDVVIFEGQDLTLDAGNPGAAYAWSTGATSQTIKVSTSGTYRVTVTNSHGCSGGDEIKIAVVPAPVGVSEVNIDDNSFGFHPNPAREMVIIRISDPKLRGSKLTLIDASGRVVHTVLLEGMEQQLSLDGLASGIYFIKAENHRTWKLVKQ